MGLHNVQLPVHCKNSGTDISNTILISEPHKKGDSCIDIPRQFDLNIACVKHGNVSIETRKKDGKCQRECNCLVKDKNRS